MGDPRTDCANQDGTNPVMNWFCAQGGYPVGSGVQQCVDAGNAFTSDLDAKIADIAKNWQPPDTFDSGQIRGVVTAVMSMINQAQAVLSSAIAEPNANQSDLANAQDELFRHGAQAIDYTTAANAADAAGDGAVVSAPNLKQWVLNAMNSASSAMVAAYVVNCIKPWWVGDLAAFQTAFDNVWGVVKSIVGAVVAVGKAIIHAGEGAATAVAWTAKVIAWLFEWWPFLGLALVGGGGYLAYRKYKNTALLTKFLKR
jgi:hypothetical protein